MFRGTAEIAGVVELLESRSASLWHACQLRDLRSYLAIGGIPSRSLLEQANADFTPFATDSSDRSKGLWSQVFLNLGDFGTAFARGWAAVPNPYGPIAIQIRPSTLLRAHDVAVCLRSAGAWDFDRQVESLDTVADLDRIFINPIDSSLFDRMEIRFGEALRRVFAPKYPNATSAEISATMEPELIPFEDVVVYWVDPIRVGERSLIAAVEDAVRTAGASQPIQLRQITSDRRQVMVEITHALIEGVVPQLRMITGRVDISSPTREWAEEIVERDLAWQFERFARYLTDGTLLLLGGDATEIETAAIGNAQTDFSSPPLINNHLR